MDLHLIQEAAEVRRSRNEALRLRTREKLREALRRTLPESFDVFVFGSICQENRFSERSDVDVAVEAFPEGTTLVGLTAELSERLSREVDVLLLSQSRFADSIRERGERWTV